MTTSDFTPTVLYIYRYNRTINGILHTHEHIELHYILSGSGKYSIEGNTYPITKGDLIVINPGESHAHICSSENPLEIFSVGFENIHLDGEEKNRFYFPSRSPILQPDGAFATSISKLCRSILEEEASLMPQRYFMLRAYLTQLLITILRSHSKEPARTRYEFASNQKSYIVNTISEYLNIHYKEHVSLDEIAGNMYLSPVYISKIFKEVTGDSPINHLIQIRLKEAKKLMATDHTLTIRQIANEVGYEDSYYFSRLFKKYFGIAPTLYQSDDQ